MGRTKSNGFKQILFSVFLFAVMQVQGQTKAFSPQGSFSLDLGVPAKSHNPAFQRVMEGLLNAGVDYRYNVFKGLTVGVGFKYAFFTLNSFAFNNTAISGSYHAPGGFIHLGYEKFTSERIAFSGSVRGGYSLLMSYNDSCKVAHDGPSISETFFLEPQVEMVMLTDKVSQHGFSLVLGYSFYFHEFNHNDVCMENIPTLTPESYEGITRYLSIGFGYRYYMGRR